MYINISAPNNCWRCNKFLLHGTVISIKITVSHSTDMDNFSKRTFSGVNSAKIVSDQ